MSEDNGLPTGWAWSTVGDIARVGTGTTPSRTQVRYWNDGRFPWITSSAVNQPFVSEAEQFVTEQALANTTLKIYPKNTLIVALYGEGKTRGKVSELLIDATINQALAALGLYIPDQAHRRFVKYFLQGNYTALRRQAAGGMQPNLNLSLVNRIRVPVAPLSEQGRIVAKIEELFSELDAGVTALERARGNLNRYRASVLKAAVDGSLTAEWRAKHPQVEPATKLLQRILADRRRKWEADQLTKFTVAGKPPPKNWQAKYKAPTAVDSSSLPDVPIGWAIASVDEVTTTITSGSRDWTQFYGHGSGTFIMAQNVRPGRFDGGYRQAVDPPEGDRDKERSQVMRDDLLVTIVGANTGDVCRIPTHLPEHYVCQSVALMRPVDASISQFAEFYFQSDYGGQLHFGRYIYGQGRPHLGFDQIRMTPVVLPPIAEQVEIVRELEERLSQIDAAEKAIDAGLRRASRLRQSILKQAFAGKLVPQDPADEPATALLARLQASRTTSQPTSNGQPAPPAGRQRAKSTKRSREVDV